MKQYIGTKRIAAEPMNRLAYNVFRGWTLPEDENGDDEGYLVEYLDGGKPNVASHAGYVSWSPKAQFDAAYHEATGAIFPAPHQQRVADEKAELDDKLNKLVAFFGTPFYKTLRIDEQARLAEQCEHMSKYSEVLAERIAAFYTTGATNE